MNEVVFLKKGQRGNRATARGRFQFLRTAVGGWSLEGSDLCSVEWYRVVCSMVQL